jgi:hypothetical protein
MKKLLVLVAFFGMGAFLAGCGGEDKSGSKPSMGGPPAGAHAGPKAGAHDADKGEAKDEDEKMDEGDKPDADKDDGDKPDADKDKDSEEQ